MKSKNFKERLRAIILKMFYFVGRRIIGPLTPFNRVMATILMLKSKSPANVDAVAFFGRTPADSNDDIFNMAYNLQLNGAKCIAINGIESERLGLSSSAWEKRLRDLGAWLVEKFKPSTNTASEALAIIEMAKEKGWTQIILLAHAHQVLRCMRAIVAAMNKLDYKIDVYAASPATDWFEMTAGSQNLNIMPRIKHTLLEYGLIVDILSFLRIVPPIASVKDVINYIKQRDS